MCETETLVVQAGKELLSLALFCFTCAICIANSNETVSVTRESTKKSQFAKSEAETYISPPLFLTVTVLKLCSQFTKPVTMSKTAYFQVNFI